ncbi:MAG: serine hydrolase [Victivallales bacterium]
MKKFIITFAIVAVVIGAHVILLRHFIFPAKKQPVAEETKSADQTGKSKLPPPLPEIKGPVFKPYNYRGAVIGNLPAVPASKTAGSGILVDLGTRQVLWAKNPRKSVAIASMTKMLTELIVFEELEKRKDVTLETQIQVTPAAAKIGGSQIYLDPKESFPLEDLLKAVMISSANDAAYLVAEHFGNGDVNAFVDKMNKKATELKLPGAKFYNPHGLPGDTSAEDNTCSAEGCSMLAERLLEIPKAAEFARTKATNIRENTAKPFTLFTHNHLLGAVSGVNGMKTGFIKRSGFCITVTCDRGGRKMAACVTGFPDRKGRDAFVAKLLEWGYKQKPVEVKTNEPIQPGNEDKNLDDLLNKVVPK